MVVDYKKEGRIAIFTINRPEAMNALSEEVHRKLNEAMTDFRDDPELWVAILTGAGDRAFSAGQDITSFRPGPIGQRVTAYNLADKIWKPFIAAINGYALGGGLERCSGGGPAGCRSRELPAPRALAGSFRGAGVHPRFLREPGLPFPGHVLLAASKPRAAGAA